MAILSNLEPKRVFEIFEEMCAIPHGSTNTKAISDWCVAFGEKLGLEHYQDEANNVILIAPATPGYEDAPAVILQGHVDMVCEKEAGCAKDMDKEGLDLFVDGDLVGAKGTTLGGDDGIAVAMALAALEDTTVQHPRLDDSGIRPYFKGIFISEELGADKPSKSFFDACFAAIPGFRTEEAVMVGDSLTSDIRGGRDAGLRTVWFNPQGREPRADIRPDYTIHALSELPSLLEFMQ